MQSPTKTSAVKAKGQTAVEQERDLNLLVDGVEQLSLELRSPHTHALRQPDLASLPRRLNAAKRSGFLYVMTDLIALVTAFVLAGLMGWAINEFILGQTYAQTFFEADVLQEMVIFMVIGSCALLWLEAKGHYRARLSFWTEIQHIFGLAVACVLVDGFLQFASKQDLSRLWLVGSWALAGFLIIIFRMLSRYYLRGKGQYNINTLLVGSGPTAQEAKAALAREHNLGYEIKGQLRGMTKALAMAGGSWERLLASYDSDFVLIALEGPELHGTEEELSALTRSGLSFAICPPMRGLPLAGMQQQYFFSHDVMFLTRANALDHVLPRLIKRSFDIVVSSALMLLCLPFFPFICFKTWRETGRVFYAQKRVGMHNKLFDCYKFCSMKPLSAADFENHLNKNPGAREEWNRFQKLKDDPRVGPFGAMIRRKSIDEIPQLFNVLKGDMSLVGPRPIMQGQESFYEENYVYYKMVRPGITGPWQVSGRNQLTFKQRVALESCYAKNWSLWTDVAILFKTIPVVFGKKGAY